MKNTFGTIQKLKRNIGNTPDTNIHDRSFAMLGTGSSINSGRVKLVLWTQTK
jgi:hypothetical protein